MKPKIYEPECPGHLAERAEEGHLAELGRFHYRRWPHIAWQEERDGLLYTYIYDSEKVCEGERHTPEYLIAADMEKRKWDTWSFSDLRWGKKMLTGIIPGYEDPVTEYIDERRYGMTLTDMQNSIRAEERKKRWEKKEREIQEDMAKARELPEGFLTWAGRQLPPYLVYEPGDRHRGYCTRCRKETVFAEKLEKNRERTCPHCRGRCRVKTPKLLPEMTGRETIYVQRTGEGIMVRFIGIYKKMREGYKDGLPETSERLRVVFDRGKRERWYEKRGYGYDDESWYRNNVDSWTRGINNPGRAAGYYKEYNIHATPWQGPAIYRKNMPYVIKDSILRHLDGWEKVAEGMDRDGGAYLYGFIDLYEGIHRYPQAESLWKLGFERLALDIMKRGTDIKGGEKELHKCLGISKEMWRCMLGDGNRRAISLWRIREAREYDRSQPDKALAWEASGKIPPQYRQTFHGLNLGKVLRYIKDHSVGTYGDYLSMANNLGYDLRDDFVSFPRDLEAAHEAAAALRDEERDRARLEEAKKDDKKIAKVAARIRRDYTFDCGGYLFRPAGSNYEIVKEGQALHHCVGTGIYKNKMLQGTSYIIFMRKKEEPDQPYYTIEITPAGDILQAYGKYNQKPDWDTAGAAIRQYAGKVRERQCQKASCRKKRQDVTGAAQTA